MTFSPPERVVSHISCGHAPPFPPEHQENSVVRPLDRVNFLRMCSRPHEEGRTLLVAVAVLTIMSIAALIAAITVGSGVIAYACVGMCVAGLLLLLIDVLRSQQDPDSAERRRTAGDDLFGEKEVSRDLIREDSVSSQDMLRFILPSEEGHRF
jgi:hypothetical protein